jgi:hydrogenase expression/formation protein HypC
MCMGIPMQVLEVSPGFARVRGRGETKRVDTALIEPPQPGDWLLIFLDGAREAITALDLVAEAMAGLGADLMPADPGFDLPSAMSAEQLAALAGVRR